MLESRRDEPISYDVDPKESRVEPRPVPEDESGVQRTIGHGEK